MRLRHPDGSRQASCGPFPTLFNTVAGLLLPRSERKCRVVEMRFFGGLSDEEIAEVLKITTRTVLRDWKTARLWLYRELSPVPD